MDEKVDAQPFNWVEESNELLPCIGRKRRRTKRKEFVRWGSKQLISFLESIGKSTEEKLSQHDVSSIINQYITENNLIDPAKKKRVLCDASLQAIFGRKSIARIKIFNLLESHYAENEHSSDNEGYSSDEREEDKRVDQKPQKDSISEERAHKRKKASEAPKSCFAAIIPENIKAVYLKKTLVQKLLKDPDTFESKVLGSFVRVKADRYDYKQKNSHVLQLVTGIKRDPADGDNVHLRISDMEKDINLSELSEANFTEEECKDLHKRIIEGSLKRPTVVELQEKVQLLHEDITKHWVPIEINRLECLMDHANEKGWRGEFFEYREKKKLLQTPAEQSRLLQTVPEVIAEELKLDPVPANNEACPEKATKDPLNVTDWVISNDYPTNGGGSNPKAQEPEPSQVQAETNIQQQPPRVEVECAVEESMFQAVVTGDLLSFDLNEMKTGAGSSPKQAEVIDLNLSLDPNEMKATVGSSAKNTEVIDLSDEEDNETSPCLEERVWYYMDPQAEVQGPFTLLRLKYWSELGYFDTGFTVWKSGQSQNQQVLLTELLRKMFPH